MRGDDFQRAANLPADRVRPVRWQRVLGVWLTESPRVKWLAFVVFRRLVRVHELEVRRQPRYRAELALVFWLHSIPQAAICQRLQCGEFTALRLLASTTPTISGWGEQVTILAAKLGVDRTALAGLLCEVGAAAHWGEIRITDHHRDGER